MHTPLSRASRLLCATTLALALLAAPAQAADAPFSSRFAQTVRGDVSAVGNTLLTCPASAGCTDAQNGVGATLNNNSWNMVAVNDAGGTTNSSSATVTLPAGADVLWAGLYWSADTSAGTAGLAAPSPGAKGTVSFKVPGGSYVPISAVGGDVLTSSPRPSRYRAFSDVTALVAASGAGAYSVADVQTGTGQDRYAGWALFVAYRDIAKPIRRLNVYDGLGTVDSGHTFSTAITPFHTPATGPVTTKAGLLSFEGDASLATETATFNAQPLTDVLNPVNNAMNSTIEAGGTRFSAKAPDFVNQFGVDLDTFDNAGALANDQSSATLAFTSSNEYFMPSAFFLVSDEGPATSTGAGPTISAPGGGGAVSNGQTLSADPGSWNGTGTLTYTYQWQRCDANGADCHDIPGATGSTYTPGDADVGGTVRVVVTATNDAGSSVPTVSAPIAVKAASAPVNTAPPALAGPVAQGQALTVDTGAWSGGGTSYTYQWQRCGADGTDCINLPDATEATYTPGADDVGHTLRAVVIATNDAGSTTTTTDPSAPVAAASDPAAEDLAGIAGGLIGEASCQQLVGGAKYRRVALAGIGTVRVRAYTSGPALRSSPLRLTTELTGGRAKSVRYLFDGRIVAAGAGSRHPAKLIPSQLGKVGTHTLKTTVRGRRGRAKTVSLTLRTEPCQMLFTAQRWRTTAGAGLRLRIDSRTALTQLSFAVPSALLPTTGAKRRPAGFIRLYVAGKAKPMRFALTLPARGTRSVMLAAASGGPTVSLRRKGVRITGLPARTAVAEVTLYRVTKLDRATPARAYTVKATVARQAAMAQTLSAKPKPPR
jgi:hypothetical protein